MGLEVVRRVEEQATCRAGSLRKKTRWVIERDGVPLLGYKTLKEARRVAQGILDDRPRPDGRRQLVAVRYPR